MPKATICCAGARLTGQILSVRGEGGAVWHVDLAQVSEADYAENRGWAQMRHALRVRSPDGWHEITVVQPRRRRAQSRDLMEHRALSAAVAERLAEVSPGFRIDYRVSGLPGRMLMAGMLGVVAIAVGLSVLAVLLAGITALVFVGLGAVLVAWLLLRRGQHRRWSGVTAAALPGILTAAARRE